MWLSLEERQEAMREMNEAIKASNIEFESRNFNEKVYRLMSLWQIPHDIWTKFLKVEKWFVTQELRFGETRHDSDEDIYLLN